MVTGTSMAYVGSTQGRPVPTITDTTRAAHKPWCVDCKRTVEPLDTDQLCEGCARAAITRAAAAARRAQEETERAAAAKAAPATPELPTEGQQGKPTTRTSAPRPTPASSTTGTAPVAGPSTQGKNPPAAQDTRPAAAGGPTPTQELDAQCTHASDVLRRTWQATNPATQALRTSAIAALEALHLVLELYPDQAPTTGTRPTRPARSRIALPGEAIADAYLAGTSVADLAQQYDVSPPTITRHLDELGVTRRKQKVSYDADLIEAVRARYVDQQMTQDQVADALGLTPKVVQTAMVKGGIPARESAIERSARGVGHPLKIPYADHPSITRRYQEGESAPAIAATYGVTPTSIYQVLRKHGVTKRHRQKSLAQSGNHYASTLREQLTDLGITSHQVKTWALHNGLLDRITRGLPSQRLLEAYAEAHPTTEGAATA